MESKFKLSISDSCGLHITDNSQFDELTNISGDASFQQKDVVLVISVTNKKVSEEILVQNVVTEPDTTITIQLPNDGRYSISQTIVPKTSIYFKTLNFSNTIYGYNPETKVFQKLINNQWEDVDVSEIIQRNTVGTNLLRYENTYFSICYLYKCYLDWCNQIFPILLKNCKGGCEELDSELVFKRDFVWMTINVLNYYIALCKYEQAQQLLERVMGCNGVCNTVNSSNVKISGCGCS